MIGIVWLNYNKEWSMVSTVASQQEATGLEPWWPGAFLLGVCMFFPCLRGFFFQVLRFPHH